MTLFEAGILLTIGLLGGFAILIAFAVIRRMPSNPEHLERKINEISDEIAQREAGNAAFIEQLESVSDTLDRRRKAIDMRERKNAQKQQQIEGPQDEEAVLREMQKKYGGVTNA